MNNTEVMNIPQRVSITDDDNDDEKNVSCRVSPSVTFSHDAAEAFSRSLRIRISIGLFGAGILHALIWNLACRILLFTISWCEVRRSFSPE